MPFTDIDEIEKYLAIDQDSSTNEGLDLLNVDTQQVRA